MDLRVTIDLPGVSDAADFGPASELTAAVKAIGAASAAAATEHLPDQIASGEASVRVEPVWTVPLSGFEPPPPPPPESP